MRYLSFRLQIVAGPATGYTLHAWSPRGEGRAPFVPPFPVGEAGALQTALWRSTRHLAATGGDGPDRSPDAIGERLFTALFPGEILRLYERSLDLLAADPEAGLRLELTLDPREASLAAFQAFPWELLRQPGTPDSPALHRRQPLVRYLAVPRPVYAAPRPATLHIAAVAANPRHPDLDPLDLERELRNLRAAVGSAPGLDLVEPPCRTLADLRQTLLGCECHVLHFMGHGGSMAGQPERVLFFETADSAADPVRGTDLVNTLADFPALRLAVLNACESATIRIDFDPFAGVASSLVLGGLPAVVAMQHPISDPAAIGFSRAFYQRLAAGDPVDAAVAEGRQAIHATDRASCEWATPVLFMRTPNGELYPAKDIAAQPPPRKAWRRWALVALLVGLAGLFLGRLLGTHVVPKSTDESPAPPQAPTATSPPVPMPSQATPATTPAPTQEVIPPEPPLERPIEVTLHDGEQTTVLADQASLAVAFHQIGQEPVLTVTVNGEPHAVLGAGARFALTAGGKRYSVYVLGRNDTDRSVRLRVARSR